MPPDLHDLAGYILFNEGTKGRGLKNVPSRRPFYFIPKFCTFQQTGLNVLQKGLGAGIDERHKADK